MPDAYFIFFIFKHSFLFIFSVIYFSSIFHKKVYKGFAVSVSFYAPSHPTISGKMQKKVVRHPTTIFLLQSLRPIIKTIKISLLYYFPIFLDLTKTAQNRFFGLLLRKSI